MTWFIVVLFIEYWLIFRQLLCPHCHKIVECPVPKLSLRVTLSVAPSGGAASSHVTRPVEPATTVSVKVVTRGSATPWVHTVPHWIQYCSLYLSFNWEIQCQNKDIVISLDQLEIWPPQLYHWWPANCIIDALLFVTASAWQCTGAFARHRSSLQGQCFFYLF